MVATTNAMTEQDLIKELTKLKEKLKSGTATVTDADRIVEIDASLARIRVAKGLVKNWI